ncbi:echinoderm microtubule-associated protein-like 1 isoform X2 [Argopecten irradians]|uniref:echinoderm microtubule-associated protein-like 1 isoform X2 n=1 Tax=Argopecten irradians TaxID=31199 RepID=UPI0037114BC2
MDEPSLFLKLNKIKPSPDSQYRVYRKTPNQSKINKKLVPFGKDNNVQNKVEKEIKQNLDKDMDEDKKKVNDSDLHLNLEDIAIEKKSNQRPASQLDSSGSDVSESEMPAHQNISGSARSRIKSGRSTNSWRRNQTDTGDDKDSRRNIRTADKKTRKTPKATEIVESTNTLNKELIQDVNDPEEKALQFMAEHLKDYSRQRLRAVHMSLRHYSNVELRVSQKDLGQAFQENHVKLSNRTVQLLLERFEDQHGVDFEKMYRYLKDAHTRSGRDSVLALQCRNDLIPRPEMTSEERDNDILARLEDLLVRSNTFFDLPELREAFQYKDRDKTGRIEKSEMFDICGRRNVPVYGALLKALVKRCDGDNNGRVSWPEFLSFLEKAQETTWKKHPEMAELPEQAKKAQIQADPIVELSEETKSKLIGKLLSKKASLSKVRNAKKKEEAQAQAKNKPNDGNKTQETTKETPMTEQENKEEKRDIDGKKTNDVNPVVTNEETKQIPDKGTSPSDKTTEVSPNNTKPEDNTTPEVVNESTNDSRVKADDKPNPESSEAKSKKHTESKKKLETESKPTPQVETDAESAKAIPKQESKDKEDSKEKDTSSVVKEEGEGGMLCIKRGDQTIKLPKPANYDKQETTLDPPQERLALDWVYGYRGNDCRSNIHVLGNDEIVYFVSKIAVLYDRTSHRQRHYREHTEDIKCIAIHSNLSMIASGQFSGKDNVCAHIRIWRVDNLQTVFVLGEGKFQKAVMSISFANGQDLLAAVDNSLEKKLTLWDVVSGTLIAETTINVDVICDINFNPKYADLLVTTGKEHIAWWKMYRTIGTIQSVAQPDYETYLRARFIICLTHNDKGDLITGDSNGTIYIWGDGGNKITNFIKHAHDGPVFTLLYSKGLLLSGGRDGMVFWWTWNKTMDQAGSLQIPRSEGGVRMIQIHNESLLLGTTMNSMLSSLFPAGKQTPTADVTLDAIPITQGHFDDLRGIACVPRSEVGGDFVTAGLDGIICWFDSSRRDPVCKLVLKGQQFLCIDSNPSGKLIALGTKDGHIILIKIEGESSSDAFNKKICKDRIDTINFSPDYQHLAAGSHDHSVYVFSLKEKEDGSTAWEFIGKYNAHKGPVNSLDFSLEKADGSFLVKSCSSKPDTEYWRLDDQTAVTDKDVSAIQWASHRCKLDSHVYGLWWSKQAQESDVNCIDVNSAGNLVAMGDSNGYLSLFRYPCTKKGAFCHTYKSHTSIQKVLFVYDKIFVITIGGDDSCILQWRIV